MPKKRLLVFFTLFFFFMVSFGLIASSMLRKEPTPRIYTISVIVRGKSNSWENFKQGAEQAAGEMNVDLSFITLSEENSLSEQVSMLRREVSSGVDALVISASDSNRLAAPIEEIAAGIPVICIESPINSSKVSSYVSADNYAMGVELGKEIVKSSNSHKRLAIVGSSSNCLNVQQRREGVMSVLDPIGGEIKQWKTSDNSAQAAEVLSQELAKKEVDVIVTLDFLALEQTAQAVVEAKASYISLFGIGSTEKIASFIEQDIITGTVVQNDFGVGYLGVKAAVDTIEKRAVVPNILVEHRVINVMNMYEPENQRLLFPFIR